MTFTRNSFLKTTSAGAKGVYKVLSSTDERKQDSIPSMSFVWFNFWRKLCLACLIWVLGFIFQLLNDDIAELLKLDCIIVGKLTENFSWVHACGLIEMTPMTRTGQGTFEMVGTGCSNSGLFGERPFSGFVDEASSKRVTVFNEDQEPLRANFGV